MRRIPQLGPAVALVALAAVGAGCEYFRDTPEQELANQRCSPLDIAVRSS